MSIRNVGSEIKDVKFEIALVSYGFFSLVDKMIFLKKCAVKKQNKEKILKQANIKQKARLNNILLKG